MCEACIPPMCALHPWCRLLKAVARFCASLHDMHCPQRALAASAGVCRSHSMYSEYVAAVVRTAWRYVCFRCQQLLCEYPDEAWRRCHVRACAILQGCLGENCKVWQAFIFAQCPSMSWQPVDSFILQGPNRCHRIVSA